jgi:hypothetical protein
LVNAYTSKWKCHNFWGMIWGFLALLLEAGIPWWIRYVISMWDRVQRPRPRFTISFT